MLKQLFQEYTINTTWKQNARSLSQKLKKRHSTLYRSSPSRFVTAKRTLPGIHAVHENILPGSEPGSSNKSPFPALPSSPSGVLLSLAYCMVSTKFMHNFIIRQGNALPAPLLLHVAAIAALISKAVDHVTFIQIYRDRIKNLDTRKKAGQTIHYTNQQALKESLSGRTHKLSSWLKLKSIALIAVNYPTAII